MMYYWWLNSLSDFHESWHSESWTLLRGLNKTLLAFYTFASNLGDFGGGYVHNAVLCYCEFHENRHREGGNFLMSVNEVAFIGVLTSFSESASHSCCFSTIHYLANMRCFVIKVMVVKVNASMGRLLLLHVPKPANYHHHFLLKPSCWEYFGSGLRNLSKWCRKTMLWWANNLL
jgi:hypothetical protein